MSSASFWALEEEGVAEEEEVGGGGFEACKDSPKAFQSMLDEGRPGVAVLVDFEDDNDDDDAGVALF